MQGLGLGLVGVEMEVAGMAEAGTAAAALVRVQGLGLRVWAGRRSLVGLARGLELLRAAGMEEERAAVLVLELGLGQAGVGLGVDSGVG